MSGAPVVMPLRDAAATLGVHYQTAYNWVRQGVLPARKIGRDYEVSAADVTALGARRASGTPVRREVRVRDWAAQADVLYAAIASGAEKIARNRLDRIAAGVPLVDLCERVIAPALRRIGDDWAAGSVTIGAEHRATAICERLIGPLSARQPAGRPRGVAVTATPPGERHGMPALMAAGCLREDRWHVHHLGSDLPAEEVERIAVDAGARLVVLSCSTSQSARRSVTAARSLACAQPGLRVLTGGPGDSLYQLLELARAAAAQS